MALTLRTAITADQTTFDVLGADDLQPGDFKTLDSETVVIRTAKAATLGYAETAQYRVSAYRGAGGTRSAAHAASATLATYSGGGGGSGVTVDNTVDAPVAVTGIEAPGATFDGLVARIPPNNLLLGEASPLDPTTGFNTAITVNDESGSGATVQLLGVGDSPFAGSFVQLQSGRGTLAAPEILETGDTVGQIGFIGALAADSSDYAALILVQVEGSPAGFAVPGKMTIAVRKLGGGFGGQIVLLPVAGGVVLPSLPTSDPVSAGQLWNDAGTLKVSAG